MAISKTQPMRPAEIELVDTVNAQDVTLANHTQGINQLSNRLTDEQAARINADTGLAQDLANETLEREQLYDSLSGRITNEQTDRIQADTTLTNSLSATNQQVLLLSGEVTDLESDTLQLQSDVAALNAFNGKLKIGRVDNLVIPANDSLSTSATFDVPFEQTANCILLAQVITHELSTLFDFTLIDCTYSGFSFSIANSDVDSHTVSLGYLAIDTGASA